MGRDIKTKQNNMTFVIASETKQSQINKIGMLRHFIPFSGNLLNSYITKLLLVVFVLFISIPTFAQDLQLSIPQLLSEQTPEQETLPVFKPFELSSNEVLFKENSHVIDVIDPSAISSYFPGGRGANKLVVYSPGYGFHTGTNEFGAEAIVEDNVVTSLSGADSTIPTNGIVISGHGSAKNWIVQNITVGSKVYVNKDTNVLTVYTTSDSYMYEAKEKIKEATSIMDYYKHHMSNYNADIPQSHIDIANNYLQLAQTQVNNCKILTQYTQAAIDSANLAIQTSLPYIEKELKGTWIRPTETSREQIISTLDKIKCDGFNTIFLETYFHGKTIFPSRVMNKYGFTVQNETFDGFDPLDVWITEAHNRGIKVHIWFQSFYVGNKPAESSPSSILSVHPDWGNKTQKEANSVGATKSVSEHNGYFIDPANPQVQDFLLELLDEIITCYNPDGINLDYVRYPNSSVNSVQNAWGYTQCARDEFKTSYGVDPYDLTTSDVLWYDWNLYRRNKISQYVKRVSDLCHSKKVYLSAVIFPDVASALSTKQQDWRNWSYYNYVDGFTPLFLTYDSNMLVSMMNDVMRMKANNTQLYAGLFVTFMGGSPEDLVRQIYQARTMNADGVIIFDYAHTTPVYTNTLMAGAFKAEKSKIASEKAPKKKEVLAKKEEAVKPEPLYNDMNSKVVSTQNKNGNWVFTRVFGR